MKKIIATFLFAWLSVAAYAADDWPQFRGPEGTGHSDARNLPQEWSETKNVIWKTPIHDRGWSSPVVYGKQVWLTTASPDGRKLYALCLDRDTGKIIRDIKLFEVEKPQYAHPFNTYASPTPVIEKGRVYITFGSPGTACIDTTTFKVLWERRDFECNHFRGSGSSPVIFRDLLLMHFDGSDINSSPRWTNGQAKPSGKPNARLISKIWTKTASRRRKAICAKRFRRRTLRKSTGAGNSSVWARRLLMLTIRSRARNSGAWKSAASIRPARGPCSVTA